MLNQPKSKKWCLNKIQFFAAVKSFESKICNFVLIVKNLIVEYLHAEACEPILLKERDAERFFVK